MRKLELNKMYQDMGISPNLGRAMGVDRADGSQYGGGGSHGSEYGGGGSVFESVSAHTVADSNIEGVYDAMETFGKEQETLKEDKNKKH